MNQNNAALETLAVFERTFRPIEAGQPGADAEHTRAFEIVWMHPDSRMALEAVMREYQQLALMAGNVHFLRLAIERSSDSSPEAVIAALDNIRRELCAERDAVRAELREFGAYHAAARLKTVNHELAASDALRRAEERWSFVRSQLTSAAEVQGSSRKKLQAAGLSADDIAKIGVKPSDEEIAAWKTEAAALQEQVARIGRFFAGRPFFDPAILSEDDLATLSKWQDRRGVITQPPPR